MLGTNLQAEQLFECLVEGGLWQPQIVVELCIYGVNPGRPNNQIVQGKFSRQFVSYHNLKFNIEGKFELQ